MRKNQKNRAYIERDLEEEIKKYLNDKEILAIVGARQCGKTTLMKRVYNRLNNASFITFENRDLLDLFNNDIKGFIRKYVEKTDYLFIDEFQYAKQGGKQLKFIYDTTNTKVIISGSSAPELSVQCLRYLVGRILVFNLYPLSFEEFLKYKDESLFESINKKKKISEIIIKMINRYYDEFITFGGYPRVVLEEDYEKKKEFLKNIYNIYLLRDIKEIMQISEDEKISKIIKSLSLQTNNLVNFNELSSTLDIPYIELKKYIEILKKTFVCLESKPYFKNKRKELVKSPRFYFLDNGFRNVAVDNFQDINIRGDSGSLNENFVASEIIKKECDLKYWRTKAGAEVDFIIEKGGKTVPIEVKSTLKSPKYGKAIKNFSKEYNSNKGYIFSRDFQYEKEIDNIKIYFKPLFTFPKIMKQISKDSWE